MIIGIDPGSNLTGIAVLDDQRKLIHYEDINTKNTDIAKSVVAVSQRISELILLYKPTVIICEDQFMGKNVKTLKTLSYIKGSVILMAAINDIPFVDYAPCFIKKSYTGSGRATKDDIRQLVKKEYNIDVSNDTADAIAIANTYITAQGDKT